MVTDISNFGDSDIKKTEFNDEKAKMLRIHILQTKINRYWQRPIGLWVDEDTGNNAEFGWVLIFSCLRSLYMEVRPKCPATQQEIGDNYVDIITMYINKDFIIENKIDRDIVRKVLNKNNWDNLYKALTKFEENVRSWLNEYLGC